MTSLMSIYRKFIKIRMFSITNYFKKSPIPTNIRTYCNVADHCIKKTPRVARVTILDSGNPLGSNLALLLKQSRLIKELRVYDFKKDTAYLAKDLNQIDTWTYVTSYRPDQLKDAIKNTNIVITLGGCQVKFGETAEEMFNRNVEQVRLGAIYLAEFNPDCIYCIAKPPVEALVPMVSEEYKRAFCYNPKKIIGVTAHTTMTANSLIAMHLKQKASEVSCPIIGGTGRFSMVALFSQCKPPIPNISFDSFRDLQQLIGSYEENLISRAGNDKPRDFYSFSKAVSVARFVVSIVKAFLGDKSIVDYAFVAHTNHIREFLPYMTSVVRFGLHGVESTHMPKVSDLEANRLRRAAQYIKDHILLGKSFVTGDYSEMVKLKQSKYFCDCAVKVRMNNLNEVKL